MAAPIPSDAILAHLMGRAGAGLKGRHAQDVLEGSPRVGWFEVHAENYMVAGGPRLEFLTQVRERFALSLHGVAASLGGIAPLDQAHLQRFRQLVDRFEPTIVSEHLAWSSHAGVYYNDLLPVTYDRATLIRTADHVDQFQNAVGRTILIENPSTYVALPNCDFDEVDFIAELVRRTGCGLLLDVNNVVVSATNHGWDPHGYISRLPLARVREIHVAGHGIDTDDEGRTLLIDSHDRPVASVVWDLLDAVLPHTGPIPVLVEWDEPVPAWAELESEVAKAQSALDRRAVPSIEPLCA